MSVIAEPAPTADAGIAGDCFGQDGLGAEPAARAIEGRHAVVGFAAELAPAFP
jgi:hypothetical protein